MEADVVLNALTTETLRLLELEMIPNYKPRSWLIRTAEARGREEGRDEGLGVGREIGREEGREVGREEGREEGRREALQSLVRRVVQARFGPLPTWAQAQIDAASAAELETWVERAFTSSSTDELLGRRAPVGAPGLRVGLMGHAKRDSLLSHYGTIWIQIRFIFTAPRPTG